ncbi:hypothetical protein B566_EDAN000690 [Ephemera danica]|nr:hypothetical protein B566_EDAN000690 [Ephemera danica]
MGSSQGASSSKPMQVSEPTKVNHTAHLSFDLKGIAKLQVPELDSFLEEEGIKYSERDTWEVLRFVYQSGGLPLVRDTLKIIQERRSRAAMEMPEAEPLPDYEKCDSTGQIETRHKRNEEVSSEPRNEYTSPPVSPTGDQPPLRHPDQGEWSSRSSTGETEGQPQKRPASKVWKMPMSEEVHQDLLRALRVRSRDNLINSAAETTAEEPSEKVTTEQQQTTD